MDIKTHIELGIHIQHMNKLIDEILLEVGTTRGKQVWFTRPEVKRAVKLAFEHKQAQIDLLMLEFCPELMTEEQIAEWESKQAPCSDDAYNEVCVKLGLPTR